MNTPTTRIAIVCQGGGSHCAYTGGVLAAPMRSTEAQGGRPIIDVEHGRRCRAELLADRRVRAEAPAGAGAAQAALAV